jgi:hypothetical protein
VSFDSSTPLRWAGQYQTYAATPNLTEELASWKISNVPFPVGFAAATSRANEPFPDGSPLSTLLTLGDMNPDQSPYSSQTFDAFSSAALSNHNLYVMLRAIINANDISFNRGNAPQEIADMVGAIQDLFMCESWADKLSAVTAISEKALPG